MSALVFDTPAYALEIRTADTRSPRRARNWLAWILEAGAVPQHTIDAAVLAVSELVTNAVVHTDAARLLVSARVTAAGVALAVHDDAATSGEWAAPGTGLDESGRGLVIVRALAAEFHATTGPAGTTVTAVIA